MVLWDNLYNQMRDGLDLSPQKFIEMAKKQITHKQSDVTFNQVLLAVFNTISKFTPEKDHLKEFSALYKILFELLKGEDLSANRKICLKEKLIRVCYTFA